MRWGYLVPRLVVVTIVWAFFAFAFDPLLRHAMIGGGQNVTEARVEIDGVQTTFFPPSVSLNGVQVANKNDPWKNLFELETFQCRLEGKPLLRKSFVINDASITGLQWNTPRTTSGALTEEELAKNRYAKLASEHAEKLTDSWYDDFVKRMKTEVDPNQLASVKLAEQLKTDWTKRFASYEKRVADLEKKLKRIEQTAKSAKGNTFQKIEAYRKAAQQSQQLLAEAERIKTDMQRLPGTAQNDFRQIEAARQQDQITLRKKLDLFKLDAETLTATLIGPTLQARMDEAVDWSRWIKDGIKKITYRGPTPERMRGVNIPFPRKERLPTFLLRTLHISGKADWQNESMPFAGTITGITSDPKRHGQPIVVKLKGKATSELAIVGTADYTTEQPMHQIRMTLTTPQRQQLSLGDKKKMGLAVSAGYTVWTADVQLVGDQLNGHVKLTQQQVQIVSTEPPSAKPANKKGDVLDVDVHRLMQAAVADIKDFEATVVLSGTYEKPKWALQSNLGTQIADGMNRMIAQEITAKQRQLTKEVDQAVAAKTGELSKQLNGQYGSILSQLQLQETGVQQLLQKLAGGRAPLDVNRLFRR